jgi:hypothetical protein
MERIEAGKGQLMVNGLYLDVAGLAQAASEVIQTESG